MIYFISGVLAGLIVGWFVEWLLDWRAWRIAPLFLRNANRGESVRAESEYVQQDERNRPTPSTHQDK